MNLRRPIAWTTCLAALWAWAGLALAEPPSAAAALRSKHDAILPRLEHNAFGRPLELESWEKNNKLGGDVYAVVQYPFATVQTSLRDAASWCDILILPFNTKHCQASGQGSSTQLRLRIGRKAEQAAKDAYPLEFDYRLVSSEPDYLRVELSAPSGPLGTRDYRMSLESIPLDANHSFIHLGYTYGFSSMSRFAMQAYLSTVGAHKVGFTVTGHDGDGSPQYVGGMLGATERNTMRYFLAVDAYLATLDASPGERLSRRLATWFAASERYPRQLHEMDRDEYFSLKLREARAVNVPLG